MSDKNKIRSALEIYLNTFAQSKAYPVLWENVSSIPEAQKHLEPRVFFSDTQDPSIGVNHRRYKGIFRVSYYTPELNKGMGPIQAAADEIVNHFKRGTQLTFQDVTVHIENTPSYPEPISNTANLYVPIDIYFRCDIITNS
jgi:hypothetical protein